MKNIYITIVNIVWLWYGIYPATIVIINLFMKNFNDQDCKTYFNKRHLLYTVQNEMNELNWILANMLSRLLCRLWAGFNRL